MTKGVNPSLTGLEIAVVGMAGRFPGAKNVNEFWNNLKNGVDSISTFTDEEIAESGVEPSLYTRHEYVKRGGVIEDKDLFDSAFFDYTPGEASAMDPQMRLFHECLWTALEDAGYDPSRYNDLIGVYAGASSNVYWHALTMYARSQNSAASFAASQLADKDFLSTRVSYKLGLKGPSILLQTACSTSLSAIHQACRALLTGECKIALAGGVSLKVPRKKGYLYQEGMIGSPDGFCRAFDARGKGTVGGEGVGVVVLKTLKNALKDGDHIYAVIKGSALNNDGNRKVGYTAPSIEGQSEVIRAAQRIARVEPESISYVEAHGTGTVLGDPVEVEALKLAFHTDQKGFCGLGSVKTNVGHLDAAAGVTGFIKTVLALYHRQIPPSLHYETPNPKIDFENSPFYVNTELKEWKSGEYPRRAGVSSFGIGGTNAHVVLEEVPEPAESSKSREHQILVFSAKTPTALEQRMGMMADYLANCGEIKLADAAYTLQVGRKDLAYRKMFVAKDRMDAYQLLTTPESGKIYDATVETENRPVVFMFSGQGSQYINMGLELYRTEPVFKREVDTCFEILKSYVELDLRTILFPEDAAGVAAEMINRTEVTQPIIFTFEYALAKLLMHWGIQPYAMIGHSIGEYVAACLAGVFSLEDGLHLIARRGELMGKMLTGAMLSVPLSEKELLPLLGDQLTLAAVNGPLLCVVSGEDTAIDEFAAELQSRGLPCRKLQTSHAFHSRMMEPMMDEFIGIVKQVQLHQPERPYLSNVTGDWITVEEAQNPAYWAKHLRETVRFEQGMNLLMEEAQAVFIEVGPGNTLSTFARKNGKLGSGHQIINLIRHPHEEISDQYYLLNRIGQLWLAGVKLDWTQFYGDEQRKRLPLPTYPFEGVQYSIDGDSLKLDELLKTSATTRKHLDEWLYVPSWERESLLHEEVVLPERQTWLVFEDEVGFGREIISKLITLGQEVITVRRGANFTQLEENQYTINPKEGMDFERLIHDLHNRSQMPEKILFLWGISGEQSCELDLDTLDELMDAGFYSLLELAKALGQQEFKHQIKMAIVTDHLQEVLGTEHIAPEKATLLGPGLVIGREYPNIRCCNIDLVCGTENEHMINQLFAELAGDVLTPVIAYRGNYRWTQTVRPIKVEQPSRVHRFKDQGVYLITGGFGGIGFTIAEELAREVQARLILISRSPMPERDEWDTWLATHGSEDQTSQRIQQVLKLETLGSQVMAASVDVADLQQMENVIQQGVERFGHINGVIHSAGVADGGIIQIRTREMSKTVLAPKVQGTLVLDQLLKNQPLDFFVICSSLSSVLGPFGQVAYCAANAFEDAFAIYKRQTGASFTVAIDWETWLEVGMAVQSTQELSDALQIKDGSASNRLAWGITPSEGVKMFQRILSSPHRQVMVSTWDLTTRIEKSRTEDKLKSSSQALKEAAHSKTTINRSQLGTTYVAPQDDLEGLLAGVWEQFFGIDQIGIHDNFFDLNATSLDMIQVNIKLKELLNRDIPVVKMFTYPTIHSLAEYLKSEERPEQTVEKKIDRSDKIEDGKNRLKAQMRRRK